MEQTQNTSQISGQIHVVDVTHKIPMIGPWPLNWFLSVFKLPICVQ